MVDIIGRALPGLTGDDLERECRWDGADLGVADRLVVTPRDIVRRAGPGPGIGLDLRCRCHGATGTP